MVSKPAFPNRQFLHDSRADAVAYAFLRKVCAHSCVRRQQRQVEELGHPRTRESVVPGHVGVVLESARLDLPLDSVGQAQQAHLRRGLRLPGHGHKDDRDHRALVPALRGPGDDPQFLFAGAHRQNQSASDPELLPQRRGH